MNQTATGAVTRPAEVRARELDVRAARLRAEIADLGADIRDLDAKISDAGDQVDAALAAGEQPPAEAAAAFRSDGPLAVRSRELRTTRERLNDELTTLVARAAELHDEMHPGWGLARSLATILGRRVAR